MRLLNPTTSSSAGLLLLRVVVGVTFLLHGLDKLSDLAGTERFFVSLAIPAPGLMALFVAVTETVGGLLLIAGLVTRLAGAALSVNMVVALATAHDDLAFFVTEGGIELEALLAGASLALVLTGAGRISLDDVFDLAQYLPAARTRTGGLTRHSPGREQARVDAKVTR